jgi:hypothetical protein
MNSDKLEVSIYLYDISNGMARSFSPMFLGKTIEGIWHTGLVVYGNEYYYGGGVCVGFPKVITCKIRQLHTELRSKKLR